VIGQKGEFALEVAGLKLEGEFAFGALRYWFAFEPLGHLDEVTLLNTHAFKLRNLLDNRDKFTRADFATLDPATLWSRLREYEANYRTLDDEAFDAFEVYVVFDGLQYRFVWRARRDEIVDLEHAHEGRVSPQVLRKVVDELEQVCASSR